VKHKASSAVTATTSTARAPIPRCVANHADDSGERYCRTKPATVLVGTGTRDEVAGLAVAVDRFLAAPDIAARERITIDAPDYNVTLRVHISSELGSLLLGLAAQVERADRQVIR
jgi:hypothetical protein